ncbi:glycoside hydrolase family 57 protein [Chryseolinea lacunae]|uniref:Glycoside hydrolase family 57 protein n=1 Tax=Chryseolinea lacunae TaxID=2801331 RepID=A0ABS1KMA1_9BACT|nr:glycoside hydrolase family 57 protein [Chryseolinea lacunae]MBL0740595.1 glycoside hydrolase family 57 protein [Chryseolinea lacunae]
MKSHDKSPLATQVVLYFQIHQPWRLRPFHFFDIGSNHDYFDTPDNEEIAARVARQCYLPANALLLKLIQKYPQLKVAFSISGVALDQFQRFCPEVIDSFRKLATTGSVEFLGETDYHSLASVVPGTEFEEQVLDHTAKLQKYLGVHPSVFRNTELIYSNAIGRKICGLGFNGVFLDGIGNILGTRSRHQLYHHPEDTGLRLFLRDYTLSDDIAFRFQEHGKKLTPEKFMTSLAKTPAHAKVVTLAMDYETFGEHQKKESGIFKFLEGLLTSLATSGRFHLIKPSDAVTTVLPAGPLDVPDTISWADTERDLSAWLGNDMQQDAFENLVQLGTRVKALHDAELTDRWRRLLTSDHFYYMSTKKSNDGEVHAYFSPYASPYEAFVNYMNVIHDFTGLVGAREKDLSVANEQEASLKAEAERREMHTPVWAMKLENSYEK